MRDQAGPGGRPAIVALWSAPRCRSTAFARMMAERGDYTMLHEPFSHLVNFGEADVGGQLVRSEPELIPALWRLAEDGPVFFKDTTDFHYPWLLRDRDFLAGPVHTFLIRHPAEAIASHFEMHPRLNRDEVGFAWLAEIYDAVAAAGGTPPAVIDAADLVASPEQTVRAYCRAAGIPFLPAALSWRPGMHQAWQRTSKWHETASQTTGFVRTGRRSLDAVAANPLLAGYLDYHLPHYERLKAVALRV
ncbi:MAG TPA: sulfotransferase family protein [Streptosporangiaceae bacterium]